MTRTPRTALALPALALLGACASGPIAPAAPNGPGVPINSAATVAALLQGSAPLDADEARRREHARAVLFLPEPTTLAVPFAYGSTRFAPTPSAERRIAALAASAERIEARGHADGLGDPQGDRLTARRRAESARAYLVERGADPASVAVTYRPGVDALAGDIPDAERREHRRVDLVFWPALPASGEPR